MGDGVFTKGQVVEISTDDDGFRGAWYVGTVVRLGSKRNRKVLVEYKSLMADEKGKEPLTELVEVVQLRPLPPPERGRNFQLSEEVDAFHNDGWWEGVVMEVRDDGTYSIFFRCSREQIVFRESDLRLHREWISNKWVPPLPKKEASGMTCYREGERVEVSTDEDGFEGAWFSATVNGDMGEGRYLVQYDSLRAEDGEGFLEEEVTPLNMRPHPPETIMVDRFGEFEEVDALYNDGWWVGMISRVLKGSNYMVYFRETEEELQFDHSNLRQHQDWIDGKWLTASKALNFA